VAVVREMGARGRVDIPIATKPGTAKGGGDDYEDIDEILHFEDGESRYCIMTERAEIKGCDSWTQ